MSGQPLLERVPATPRRPRRGATTPTHWFPFVVATTAAFHLVFIARTAFRFRGALHFSLFDDAMISMRYARNLGEGHGLLWNPGEAPVEGITNPLWTVWMAVLHGAPVPDRFVALLVALTSSALLLLTLVMVKAVAERLAPRSAIVPPVAVVLTATTYSLSYWSLRGMEVGLLAFLSTAGILLLLRLRERDSSRDVALLSACFVAAVLTRLDAVSFVGVLAVFAVVAAPEPSRVPRATVLAGTVVGALTLLTLLRILYFGEALPNTYYLKMTGAGLGERMALGWRSLEQAVVGHLLAPVLLAATACGYRLRRQPVLGLLAAMFVVQAAYSVYVGGDAWDYLPFANRYLAVVLPALWLLAAVGVDAVAGASRRSALRAVAVLSAAVAGGMLAGLRGHGVHFFVGWDVMKRLWEVWWPALVAAALVAALLALRPAGESDDPARRRIVLATLITGVVVVLANYVAVRLWVSHNGPHVRDDAFVAALGLVEEASTDPDARIAVWWAGNGPYYSTRRSIDVLGKSDEVVARMPVVPGVPIRPGHDKYDLEYSLGRLRPDVIDRGVVLDTTTDLAERLDAWGYEPMGLGMYAHRDSTRVDRERMRDELRELDENLVLP